MVGNDEIAELLLPETKLTPEELEARYPERNLPEGAYVTRFAPSPTGFLHTGSLFTAFLAHRLAKQSGGVFFLRIEDTDTKRTIAGSAEELIEQLARFGIVADEGFLPEGEKGAYGPYRQSERGEIYKVFVKKLLKEGKAYPDFCTAEDLAKIRAVQEASKVISGYWGPYARDRKLTNEERKERILRGDPWVIRFRSEGNHDRKVRFHDEIRGDLDIAENDIDVVILKSDGLPTYHFAHVVDDHLMRTNLVSRGEEWIPSTPVHLELFRALGWEHPRYAHLPVIMKLDHGNKRKLSKRKDPEAAVSYFLKEGYPPESLLVYLMSIANSNFEEWTEKEGSFDYRLFSFSLGKMSLDGALFDLDKLTFFSRELLAKWRGKDMLPPLLSWAKDNDPALASRIERDPSYMEKILDIEKDRPNPRKDYAKWSDVAPATAFFYRDLFEPLEEKGFSYDPKYELSFVSSWLEECAGKMLYGVDEATWWSGVKELASKRGFATRNKDYKEHPEDYVGSLVDAAELLRLAITGAKRSPNLHEVISILGEEETKRRLLHEVRRAEDSVQ